MDKDPPLQSPSEEEEQPPITVSFLGPTATYTHQAALSYFGNSSTPPGQSKEKQYTLLPSSTIPLVFQSVRDSHATYGVVPYENSTNGGVAATLDLLAAAADDDDAAAVSGGEIRIVGEEYVPVHHCLLGRRLSPNSTITNKPSYSHITTLYSHPQAWGQCTSFLSQNFPHAQRKDCSSTSRAAELAAEDFSGASAAVANGLAAEENGLEILAENIVDDVGGNETRFLILRRKNLGRREGKRRDEQRQQAPSTARLVTTTTLLTFVPKTSEDSPSSSRDVGIVPILSLLQQQSQQQSQQQQEQQQKQQNGGVEITKLHSRPRPSSSSSADVPESQGRQRRRRRRPWEYIYLVELRRQEEQRIRHDGNDRNDDDDDGGGDLEDDEYLNGLLSPDGELAKLVESVRCLGVWEDRLILAGGRSDGGKHSRG
jgi:prephenate dehydratase